MICLYGLEKHLLVLHRLYPYHRRLRPGDGGEIGDVVSDSRFSDITIVVFCLFTHRGVYDYIHHFVLHMVHDVRPPLVNLEYLLTCYAVVRKTSLSSRGGQDLEAELLKFSSDRNYSRFILVGDRDEHRAFSR